MKIALSIALFSALIVAPLRAAETELDVAPVVAKIEETETRIALQNIKPDVMAQWLQPEVFGAALVPVDESFGKIALSKDWKLVPNNSNNTLAVHYVGSDKSESIEDLREIVKRLDQPIPQIEISMKLIKVPSAGLGFFGLTDSTGKPAGFSVSFGSREIEKLIATRKATVISAPRVTT